MIRMANGTLSVPTQPWMHRHLGLAALSLCANLPASACARPSGSGSPPVAFEEVIAAVRETHLEENSEVINVTPAVTVDPFGGFLVADFREFQVRKYGGTGTLLWHTGRRGSGPGEFLAPKTAVRLVNGDVLVAELNTRFTLMDSTGVVVRRSLETPFYRIEDVEPINDSLILVSANAFGPPPAGPLLHLWNLRTDTIVRSFFNPFENTSNELVATIGGWAEAAVRADTVAVIYSAADSVFLYNLDGERIRAFQLPSDRRRAVSADDQPSGLTARSRRAFLGGFDLLSDIFWLSDESFLVSYFSVQPGIPDGRQWHLLHVDAAGGRLFDIRNTARLLTVSEYDTLVFLPPTSEVPNRWVIAVVR